VVSIKTENLSKRFNTEWIVRNLNYSFEAGNTYAITGPNGSGKSTLLQLLLGQMPQTSGSISYKAGERSLQIEEIYQHIMFAAPYMDLIDELTLEEQLHFHFKTRTIRQGLTINTIIEKLYLTTARNKAISNFSSGMKQRLKLGLAFFTEASIILLDEPGSNLDDQAFAWYKQNLMELPPQQLVIIASNQPAEYPENSLAINILDYKPLKSKIEKVT
jgi:ABC-type multidrug transport system ATPase subunit